VHNKTAFSIIIIHMRFRVFFFLDPSNFKLLNSFKLTMYTTFVNWIRSM